MIKPRGLETAPIVFIGGLPNYDDVTTGEAWSSENVDNLVWDVLQENGINYNQVAFINAMSIPNQSSTKQIAAGLLMDDAHQHLLPWLAKHPRRLIVAFGNEALCALGVVPKPEKVTTLRGKELSSEIIKNYGISGFVTCTPHPWGSLKEPETADDFRLDLGWAFRASGIIPGFEHLKNQTQEPINIVDLEDPDQIDDLLQEAWRNGRMSYDYETTGLNPLIDFPVTMSTYTGEMVNGIATPWFWASHDRLELRFNERTINGFKEKFAHLFSRAGEDYDLIAWNGNFDDWITEEWLKELFEDFKKPFSLSQFDAMLMKWQVRSRRPHGLKQAVARDLGYANYDKEVDENTAAVRARRGKLLTHEDDFRVLQYFGYEPEKTARGFKWPESADKGQPQKKGLAMYAMIPYEIMRRYNAYDALYTYRLFDYYGEIIDQDGLGTACDLRHEIRKELLKCQQRGMLDDKETSKQFSKELKAIEEQCKRGISDVLFEMGHDGDNFNPNSGDQIAKVLFGVPIDVPLFMPNTITTGALSPAVATDRCQFIEQKVYGEDYANIRDSLAKTGKFDADRAETNLRAMWQKYYPALKPGIERMPMYLNGPYEPLGFTKGGKPGTGSPVLKSLSKVKGREDKFLPLLLILRKVSKLRGTFVDGILSRIDDNDILRPGFNPIGTDSGRISSNNPNGQNFVKWLRGQLIPRPGYKFLEWDLSQAEIRAAAAFSNDKALLKALAEADSGIGYDIHTLIAAQIFKKDPKDVNKHTERKYAKTIVFGIIYGMSAFRLSMAIGVTLKKAQEFINDFYTAFPDLKKWLENQVRIAAKPPYFVYTPWGTRRSTRNMDSTDKKVVAHTSRIAMNMPIQGAAGELTLYYICEIMNKIRAKVYDAHLVNTTHDSCTLEVAAHLVGGAPISKAKTCSCQEHLHEDDRAVVQPGMSECPDCGHIFIPTGPIVDIINDVIDNADLPEPLDRVRFVADLEANMYWSGKPNLILAVDPKYGTDEELRWDLLLSSISDENNNVSDLTLEELQELKEMEELATV